MYTVVSTGMILLWSTREEMHTLAEAARTEMIQNPEFQQQWNDSRTDMYG
jgi:hypothetical protein